MIKSSYILPIIFFLLLPGCNGTTDSDKTDKMATYNTDKAPILKLLNEDWPEPLEVKWQRTVRNEFFNEEELVAILKMNGAAAEDLKSKYSSDAVSGREYMPDMLRPWFPEEVKKAFTSAGEGTDNVTSSYPEYPAANLLKSPFTMGKVFFIEDYVLIIAASN